MTKSTLATKCLLAFNAVVSALYLLNVVTAEKFSVSHSGYVIQAILYSVTVIISLLLFLKKKPSSKAEITSAIFGLTPFLLHINPRAWALKPILSLNLFGLAALFFLISLVSGLMAIFSKRI